MTQATQTIIALPNTMGMISGVSYIRMGARKATLHYVDGSTEAANVSSAEREATKDNVFSLISLIQRKARGE